MFLPLSLKIENFSLILKLNTHNWDCYTYILVCYNTLVRRVRHPIKGLSYS